MTTPRPSDVSDEVFQHRITKDGRVLVSWRGRHVVTLKGSRASSFVEAARGLGGDELQLLLARVTGNFKRGNERPERK